MALPPIISNLPGLKFFKTEKSADVAEKNQPAPQSATMPRDEVRISAAATEKLSTEKAQYVASETRAQLEETPVSLGLNPAFPD